MDSLPCCQSEKNTHQNKDCEVVNFWQIYRMKLPRTPSQTAMKTFFSSVLMSGVLFSTARADNSREVVRDASGRLIQTIDHQKDANGTVNSVTRDASGRLIGTAVSHPNSGGDSTVYRDASGRLTGAAQTSAAGAGTAHTTYRDASGRLTGSADSRASLHADTNTQYRDAAGRLTGTSSTNVSPAGSFSGTRRDASGRLIETTAGKSPAPVPQLHRQP